MINVHDVKCTCTCTCMLIIIRYEPDVEEAYIEFLKKKNRPDEVHVCYVHILLYWQLRYTVYIYVYICM